uniref:Uncharacterized protein n=1 Tax=Craspedostauros australis TaxID=1486917 RepID=A0A7R9WMX8_9STRA|mmetsp:Transcript_12421/g.34231  ORF Transcript_12421/g.34231 Transcript_12421/m.34231 type:complete len:349 (+) Transcript_12421:136-1182(+)|eukprot:CAMPEP_0198116824 /NCGR_PEP_ID=MMETSP1442-20131203/14663_1 /TAXON_ID= /ORGANISM="Craspedostauros australis, Strain CCMP3328" /LENGTH=348 /DNA_ID=CAMNT_0043774741 /DNA_START=63 /DNA_END=1109 /DNA_ORIENTATION=+
MSRSDEANHGFTVPNVHYDAWIKDNIPDMTGKVAIITGANSGTGFWAAAALASKHCTIVMACRNEKKAAHAKAEIMDLHKGAMIDIIRMDNMDLASVRSFAKKFNAKYDRLDLLLNNAGVMAQQLVESKDGHDIQFQTNHLSHFLLTKLLWDKLVKTDGQARVINHSSMFHHLMGTTFDRNRMEKPTYTYGIFGKNVVINWIFFPMFVGFAMHDRWARYGMSKLCNVLFTLGLKERIQKQDMTDEIIALTCHPGIASTNLHNVAGDAYPNWKIVGRDYAQSAADGSLPLLMAAVSEGASNGDFYGPASSGEDKGPPRKTQAFGNGNDANLASELWDYSEECIEEDFGI